MWELIRPFQTDIKAWVIWKIDSKLQELSGEKYKFNAKTSVSKVEKNASRTRRYEDAVKHIESVSQFKYETGADYAKGILGHSDIIEIGPDLISSNLLLQKILSEKYPYFFIDESQDTNLKFVQAIERVNNFSRKFCVGFFGDPMQRIYMTGAGDITPKNDWAIIPKPENFRCPTKVLKVINKIRSGGDSLQQVGGRTQKIGDVINPVNGSAYLLSCKWMIIPMIRLNE